MPQLKLTYFDIHGGRGEPARLALSIGGIDFEDNRLSFKEFGEARTTFPFNCVPVLEVDGQTVAQSNGINRYVGKLAGLYPEDPWQAALCDEAMDAVEDVVPKVVATFNIKDEQEKKAARETLVDGPITLYLQRLQSQLEARGGQYFADNRLTVADLKVFAWIRNLKAGVLDYVPTDIVDRVAPRLVEHYQRVASHPGVAAYYESRGVAL